MKKFMRILLVVALAAGAWLLWMWLNPSPERVVRRQMEKLQENLSIKPGEGNFARVAAINRALAVFAPDIQIITEGMPGLAESINGSTELQQALMGARMQLQGEVNFHDVHVIIGPEATNAVVNFTAVARISNRADPFSMDIKARFHSYDGKWLIHRVEPISPTATEK